METGDLELIKEEYCRTLIQTLNGIYCDVSVSFPLPSQEPTHSFQPGDVVVVKQGQRIRVPLWTTDNSDHSDQNSSPDGTVSPVDPCDQGKE